MLSKYIQLSISIDAVKLDHCKIKAAVQNVFPFSCYQVGLFLVISTVLCSMYI